MGANLVQRAKEFAYLMHEGQKRKDGIPYITHPEGVVKILRKEGIRDEKTLSVGWLHDVLEDTTTNYDNLKRLFGRDIADKVYLLSRNIGRDEYKLRIENSNYTVKVVKLADTLHNIHNPYSLLYVSSVSIQRKIDDCLEFYIPLAMEIHPSLGYKLEDSINKIQEVVKNEKK